MGRVTLDSPREEIVKAWVEALRSGRYKQARDRLYDGEGYCCLGVLCAVVGIKAKPYRLNGARLFLFEGEVKVLPPQVSRAAGLASDTGDIDDLDALTELNDGGIPFADIADIIESRPHGLFADERAA